MLVVRFLHSVFEMGMGRGFGVVVALFISCSMHGALTLTQHHFWTSPLQDIEACWYFGTAAGAKFVEAKVCCSPVALHSCRAIETHVFAYTSRSW